MLHLAAGPALFQLGRGHVKARQAPDPAQQGPVIAAAFRLAVNELLRRHAGEQHPAPAAQLLRRQAWCDGPWGAPFNRIGNTTLRRCLQLGASGSRWPGQEGHHKLGGKFRTAIAVKASPQAGQAAHQHPAQGKTFRRGQQAMASLMHGNAAQAGLATRQGFGQQMAAAAAETGRIQAQGCQSQDHRQGNPGGRYPQQGPDHGHGRDAANHEACP